MNIFTLIKFIIGWPIISLPTTPLSNKIRAIYYRWCGYNIGEFTSFCNNVKLKGNIIIGKRCNFNDNVMISSTGNGKIILGDNVIIGPNVVMRNANHGITLLSIPIRDQKKQIIDILIHDDVWIGANVVVLPGAVINKGAVIGAGAVVRGEIPENSIAVGVPAKVKKLRI
jgi:galactoside O-acetyltransferase